MQAVFRIAGFHAACLLRSDTKTPPAPSKLGSDSNSIGLWIESGMESDPKDHVLVVDDDSEIRNLLSEYLQKNGFRVTVAADGKAMWGALERASPDLLVLDLMLPG